MNQAAKYSREAAETFDSLMAAPDEAIPQALLDRAEAIAVFTDVKRIGWFVSGLSYGNGVISRRVPGGWSLPAYFIFNMASLGPQLGSSSTNIVLLFMNDEAVSWFRHNRIRLEGEKRPNAGPLGRTATAEGAILNAHIIIYSFNERGRFVGLVHRNILIAADNDLNRAIWGMTARDFLASMPSDSSSPNVPEEARMFPQTLSRYSVRAAAPSSPLRP